MVGVMETAIKLDDNYVQKEIELFSRLTAENQVWNAVDSREARVCSDPLFFCVLQGLKELLDIASHNGSLRNSLLGIKSEDKEIQADVSGLDP